MKKICMTLLSVCLLSTLFNVSGVMAQKGPKVNIKADQIKAFSNPSNPISNAVDGNATTAWKSIPFNGYGESVEQRKETRMSDHNRYITIALDATYNLDEIKIVNELGSYNNYYIYVSKDGTNFDKVVSKTDNKDADAQGDVHSVGASASYIRLNMAYNSNSYETNLSEIEVYGTKTSDTVAKPKVIATSSWEGSTYQKEWDAFEKDDSYANKKTIQEVKDLVARVIGTQWVSKFRFELRGDLNGNDVFELENGNGLIIIRGNDGVSLASGFNYYLKNYAMIDYNPLFESNTDMKELVKIDKKIVKETQYDIRYALNFCTYSYTMAFWGWDEYEEFIDWAAMNGVNLMLDIVGQEEVLRQTLKQYNFSDEEIKDYIAGPGYFAWFYMQNLYSFGGPLPDAWFEQRVELGRKMHDRMQAFSIDPVIQGFSGQVPLSFDDKNEGSVLTPIDEWPSFTRPAIIKTYLSEDEVAAGKKDYFKQMSVDFYEAQKNVFGDVSNYYAADPFHEGGNTAGLNITNIFKTVQTEMLNSNKDAIWLLQQWQGNLGDANLAGLVKPEQALALDLQTDKNPSYGVMEKYNVPWVWNMLHNFGGRMGLDGEINAIASRPAQTSVDPKANGMVGIGITPEALENSPVVYELLFDMTWSSDPIDAQKWVEKYAERRAGGRSESLQKAWDILVDTAYSVKKEYFQGAAETVVNARPGMGFSSASTWGHSLIPYDKTKLDEALQLLIDNYDEFSSSPAYRYDLADVAEQVLSNSAVEYHKLMVAAYNAGDSAEFKRISTHYLELIDLSDKILQTSDEFMLGTWVDDARNMIEGADDWTKDLFEFNARALVTTWGGERSSSLKDYSNRKWAGLTSSFYKERWSIWVENRQADLDKVAKKPANVKAESSWFLWEWQWVNRKSDDGFAFSKTPDYKDLKQLTQRAVDDFSATSLKDFAGAVESDVNVADGKLFVSDPVTSEALRKNLSDGTTSSEWKVSDDKEYTFTLDLEGTYKISSMEILLQQLAKDFAYNYRAEIFDPNTNAWQEVGLNKGNDVMSSQTILTLDTAKNQEASQIRFTMKTRNAASDPLTIAEFKVMGKALHVVSQYNVAKGLPATSTKATDGLPTEILKVTDDDINNLWKTAWSTDTNKMYPAEVYLDLKGSYDVTNVELYFEKAGLPYQFKVIGIDNMGNEIVLLDKSTHTTTLDARLYKIPVNASIKAVKVVYVGSTKQGSAPSASPAMSELKVLSLSPQKEDKKINHALKKPVSVSSVNPYERPEKEFVNDGDKATVWSYDGAGDPVGNAHIDLKNKVLIDEIQLDFEKKTYNKYYKFDVYVVDSLGTKEVIYSESDEAVANKPHYTLPVNKEIKALGVDYKGKKAGTDGWFDIAELSAIGSQVSPPDISFGEGLIENIKVADEYKNTVDRDKNTFANNIKDKEIVYDFGANYYVDTATFTFEKAQLGLRYMVFAEDSAGARSVVLDASNTNALLDKADVVVKVNRAATKLIFKHLGNNGGGPASSADPRLYEATFNKGTPKNVASSSTLDNPLASTMIDGNVQTSYTMQGNESVVLTFEKATDINMFQVLLGNTVQNGSVVNAFKMDLYDEVKKDWVGVYDGSKNSVGTLDFLQTLTRNVYASKARFTAISTGLKISELNLFEVDMSQPLVAYIKEVKETLASKRYDDNNGSYKPQSKADVEACISAAEAKLALGMSSSDVEVEIGRIKAAMNDFLKHGVIYVDRSPLLSSIQYAQRVLGAAKEKTRAMSESIATLETSVQAALELYAKYDATQADLNTSVINVDAQTQVVYVALDVDTRFSVQNERATELLALDAGDKHGQVSQTSKDQLRDAHTLAMGDYASGNSEKLTVLSDIKAAITQFEHGIINVNKTQLLASLEGVNALQKRNYDFTTWTTFMNGVGVSQSIFDTILVSQQEVEDAISKIESGKQSLVVLDRSALRVVLDNVSSLTQSAYTPETWTTLFDAYEAGNALYANDEVTQVMLNDMSTRVGQALAGLKKAEIKPTPPTNGGNTPPANGGNTANQKGSNLTGIGSRSLWERALMSDANTKEETIDTPNAQVDPKETKKKVVKKSLTTATKESDGSSSSIYIFYVLLAICVVAVASYTLKKKRKDTQ